MRCTCERTPFWLQVEHDGTGAGSTKIPVVIPAGTLDRVRIGVTFDAEFVACVFFLEDAGDAVKGLLGGRLERGFAGVEEDVAGDLNGVFAVGILPRLMPVPMSEVMAGVALMSGVLSAGAGLRCGGVGDRGAALASFSGGSGGLLGFELSVQVLILLQQTIAFRGGLVGTAGAES